ncbi:SH3 domain-containing protein [Actinoplanes sp. NBC_00393]|uniref:SH3 domain-containing protein n=1 Tax=Actinoplanes sp. NBC_00393 TaxID=2975953 RepID=UPI002E1C1092
MQQQHHQQLLIYAGLRRDAAQLVEQGRYAEAAPKLLFLARANPGDQEVQSLLRVVHQQHGLPYEEADTSGGTGTLLWIVAAVLVLIGSLVVGFGYLNGGTTETGVTGTVRPGTWNLRSGPGTSWQVVGRLDAGDRVVVACATGRWMRLTQPRPGAYVHASGLSIRGVPQPC